MKELTSKELSCITGGYIMTDRYDALGRALSLYDYKRLMESLKNRYQLGGYGLP